jgi:predicted RNase H-like HicB family nuclease
MGSAGDDQMAAVKKSKGRPKRAFKRTIKRHKHAMKGVYTIAHTAKRIAPPRLQIEIAREEDGRWFGEVPALPGVLAYGQTQTEARIKTAALALHVIAERIEHGESVPAGITARVKRLFVAA